MSKHELFINRCIHLAEKGLGAVAPNPLVGAVLVHGERIIGEGWHRQFGEAHAEVNCLQSVLEEDKHLIASSTLYVSLEPCSHHGKTPPCADLIIKHSIPKVVIGSIDPFQEVNGKGIQKLQEAGVEVVTNVLEKECNFMNRRFMVFHQQKRQYIILKWAESKDGFVAPKGKDSYWLTNDISKRLSHKWRTEEAAIMVGYNTVMADNPQLTARLWEGNNPVRVVVDQNCTLPKSQQLFNNQSRTIIFNELMEETVGTLLYKKITFAAPVLPQVLAQLHSLNLQSIIIEGGQKLLNQFLALNLWDEARVFKTDQNLVEGLAAPTLPKKHSSETNLASDTLFTYFNFPHD